MLLPLLAVLQWRWIGELSEREGDHLRVALQRSALQFTWDFNQRLVALQQHFVLPANAGFDSISHEIARRCSTWRTGADNELFVDIWYAIGSDSTSVMLFDTASGTFKRASWNGAVPKIRTSTPFPVSRVTDDFTYILMPFAPDSGSSSFTDIGVDYLILQINRDYITRTVIPELAHQHFALNESASYTFAVTQRTNARNVLYSSEPSGGALVSADIVLPTALMPPVTGRDSRFIARRLSSRLSLLLSDVDTTFKNLSKEPEESREGRNSKSGTVKARPRPFDPVEVWQLQVSHRAGSLENEVQSIRWRNLAVSFGILMVLGGGMIVVLIATARSERFMRQQMQFVAGISHEFRTPLAVVRSASENLADGIVRTPEQTQRYGAVIKREINRLWEMVEQTLTFAGIQSGRRFYDFQPAAIQDIIEQALKACSLMLEEGSFAVECLIPPEIPTVNADTPALTSALQNLLSNAVKYSGESTCVQIAVKQTSSEIQVMVRDFGIGIAPNDVKRMFDPFYRSKHVVDAQIHGNGLGLTLVKHIVTQHGGRVTVESALNQGSAFTIHLPTRTEAEENRINSK